MSREENFRNDRNRRKSRGFSGEKISKRFKALDMDNLTPEERERLSFLKTMALVFYKKSDHAPDSPKGTDPSSRKYTKESDAEIKLSYFIGEYDEEIFSRDPNHYGKSTKASTQRWLKANGLWSSEDINNSMKWMDYAEKFGLEYEIGKKTITISPASMSAFLDESTTYIEALERKEKHRKKIDPTSDSTDSYLLANIKSIKNYCANEVGHTATNQI